MNTFNLNSTSCHPAFQNIYSTVNSEKRSENIGIKITSRHHNNEMDLLNDESRSSELMYDKATWRMYYRIMNSRKKRAALMQTSVHCAGHEHRECRSTMELSSVPQDFFQGVDNPCRHETSSNSDIYYRGDPQIDSEPESDDDCSGVFSIEI